MFSNKWLKKRNLSAKMKYAGALNDAYSEDLINKAKKSRSDREAWSRVMAYPTEVWRFCIYPYFKVNYKTQCKSEYATATSDEINGKIL
jgi:hypothetical protein